MASLISILTVALGLGFVIFLHELGHFLLAKYNGVKVEKFSIGFGPALLSWRRGETEYALSAIPLGGFVKMLGEEPEGEESRTADPRAFHNKSVGARMAIISAGVIMNLILGLLCFVFAYGRGGLERTPARVGMVVAGGPAYRAGLRPGDEIVSVDGRTNIDFFDLKRVVALSGAGQKVHLEVRRPGHSGPIAADVVPVRDASAEMPSIGVVPMESLVLRDPAAAAYVRPAGAEATVDASGLAGARVLKVGPASGELVEVEDAVRFREFLARHRAEPVRVLLSRRDGRKGEVGEVEVTLPPTHVVDFGFALTAGPIEAVRPGSPAAAAGLRGGDVILAVDGDEAFDPMRLPSAVQDRAGGPMTLRVRRPAAAGKAAEELEVTVTPDDTPAYTDELLFPDEPLEVPGLGLALAVEPTIKAVRPGSPAAAAGLKPGDALTAVAFTPEALPGADEAPEEQSIPLAGEGAAGWPSAFVWLQTLPAREVKLTVDGAAEAVAIAPSAVPDWYFPLRGLRFRELLEPMAPLGPMAAIRRGVDDTVESIVSTYAMFRSLVQRRVSRKMIGGPIMIARVAYHHAAAGMVKFVQFLGLLSINLAVLNFLPIPPLDGGQMAFLIAEKVRGRPLPESALVAGTYAGLLFVLGLMAFVIVQDVTSLFQ